MDRSRPDKPFLVVIRGTHGAIPLSTLQAAVEKLKRMSQGRCDLAFTSADASVAGLVLTSNAGSGQITATMDTILNAQDRGFIFVCALDTEFAATGNSSGWRHIQRQLKEFLKRS